MLSLQNKIQKKLTEALSPSKLLLKDETHKHQGHAGLQAGQVHLSLIIESPLFQGISLLKRHQLIYDILKEEMRTHIHALVIRATVS